MSSVIRNKDDLFALSLKRHLGECDRTGWQLKYKLFEAMAGRQSGRLPTCLVAVSALVARDERSGGNRDGGAEGKVAFIASVELDGGYPQRVCSDPLPALKGDTLPGWMHAAPDPAAL